jgi:DNA replication protein DnaC
MDNLNEKQRLEQYAAHLRLPVTRDEMDDFVAMATQNNWSHLTFLCNLLEKEDLARIENRRRQRIRAAAFPELKYLSELVRDELPKDAQIALPELETLQFIRDGRNVVLFGNPGTGKTHTAIGIGIKACMEGHSVLFTSVPRLITSIRESKAQRELGRIENRFLNYDLVVCDEFGYVSCDKEAGEMLFNHLSLRTGRKATVITTNLAFDRWNEIVKDKILAAAMVDRLTHKAFLVNMNGQSYRLKETQKMLNYQTK